MDKRLTNILLFSIIVIYSFFIFRYVENGVDIRSFFKTLSSMITPIPVFLFIYFVLPLKDFEIQNFSQKSNKAISTIILVGSFIFTIVLIHIYEFYFNKFGDTNLPIFLNSLILSIYLLNISRIKSINIIAFLSGIGMGISTFIIFIST